MRVVFVVVEEPPGDLPEHGGGIRQGVHANIVAFEGSTKASAMPFDSGLATGVHGTKPRARAKSGVSQAVHASSKDGEPFDPV